MTLQELYYLRKLHLNSQPILPDYGPTDTYDEWVRQKLYIERCVTAKVLERLKSLEDEYGEVTGYVYPELC